LPYTRSHLLRHTMANRLLASGVLKEVADVLRHRSLNTTMIYAKLDSRKLAVVALPWPGSAVMSGAAMPFKSRVERFWSSAMVWGSLRAARLCILRSFRSPPPRYWPLRPVDGRGDGGLGAARQPRQHVTRSHGRGA
jgi:hypothetical protein